MKILLIAGNQFGYLLDYYYYCSHCPDDIQITYLGMNVGKPEIEPLRGKFGKKGTG